MDQTFMKEKPVLPLVLKMALPMVISMLVNSLYNIVDSFFVAQVSEDAMTAISIVYPLQNLANAVGVGFGVGINAAVAYYLGAGNGKAANRSATLGIILSALHGIVLAGICVLFIRPFISMFTDSEEIAAYGLDYFYTVIAFAPVLTLGMAFEKVLQATGKMKTTMFCMAIGAVANIILDPIFISGLGAIPAMGVFGAALATGIGQSLSLISYIAVFLLAKIPVRLRLERRGEEKICRKLYYVGIPASLNLALPSFMITVLNAILAAFAEVYVLILGVYYKLQTFIYFTISGIVQGIRPLISYNLGAGRKDRVIGIFKVTLLLSLGVMVIGTILCLAIPKQLMDIFTDTPQTMEQGAVALRIISAGFIVSAISVVVSGSFEALGKGMPSLIISLLRYIAILPIALLMSYLFQAAGVWHSFWITELLSAVVSCILFWRLFYKDCTKQSCECV
ncbi:MAG TPA: MATE family efflux transporter [Candidatus Stercoripulliclostridium merdigallinarum]|uniref:Probable multidrug resistance protein NorM n=1 Tax=Candidatus Stercoripulliclostridium merdigallinarum TaxID=2840951 RepID=A0A9D1MIX1_9FIRM|nr:MATE family efflux transporter [Candidatus Stercoripulliclostridium merdigallinarum]